MEIQNQDEKIETPVNDEAELDKSLEESINGLKAGKEPEPVKAEEPEAPKAEEPSDPQIDESNQKPVDEFRLPIPGKPDKRGKFESDEVYEKRAELMDLVRRRKTAVSDEQRENLSNQIKEGKKELAVLSGKDKITNPLNQKSGVETENKVEVEDEALKADRERLKQLGGTTVEQVQEILQKERQAIEVKSTLEKFVDRHAELKDNDTREVFFDFVDSNYNWQNKSGKELMTVLELARESMFKPSETIQERVLKAANVQEKVNAMQFPGGTISKQAYSPEMKKSIDELTATGLSEEKALELLSD
jgi:hypothetical protein